MSFTRIIYHYAPDLITVKSMLNEDAVAGCWFELLRRGGCGAGELQLKTNFTEREAFTPGDWIALESELGQRWYLGRIEERICRSPAGITLSLQGICVEIGERFAGGFGVERDGASPLKIGATDLFSQDPDYSFESFIQVSDPRELFMMLLDRYVIGDSHITYNAEELEHSSVSNYVNSAKYRGEESLRAIFKELAIRAGDMSWGVDAEGKFFLKNQKPDFIATYQEGVNLISLREKQDLQMIYNRVTLTGDYVYDTKDQSGDIARRSYRWRGNYIQPESREKYGDRRLKLWIPWIRTSSDARQFMEQFFEIYAEGSSIFTVETMPVSELPFPWLGPVRLLDKSGNELITTVVERIRVNFDHAPYLSFELGPVDPSELWSEPPHDERWELPEGNPEGFGGDILSDRRSDDSGSSESHDSSTDDPTSERISTDSEITSDEYTNHDSTIDYPDDSTYHYDESTYDLLSSGYTERTVETDETNHTTEDEMTTEENVTTHSSATDSGHGITEPSITGQTFWSSDDWTSSVYYAQGTVTE